MVDALATLASMIDINKDMVIRPLTIEIRKEPTFCMAAQLADDKPWFWDVLNLIKTEEYLEGVTKADQRTLRQLANNFILNGDVLYRQSWDNIHLRYVTKEESQQIMEWVHEGEEGPHMNG